MFRTSVSALVLLVAMSSQVLAQSDPCLSGGVEILASGAPFTISWTMQQQVPRSPTDPTLVPHRYEGFIVQIDAGPETDIGLPTATVCPVGTPRAGDKKYTYRTQAGVNRGLHSLWLWAWNYVLNPDGTATTQKQSEKPAPIPFTAADQGIPVLERAPYGPWNLVIRK
jgi:hypothetical protein